MFLNFPKVKLRKVKYLIFLNFLILLFVSSLVEAKQKKLDILFLSSKDAHLVYRQFVPVKKYLQKKFDLPVRLHMGTNYESSLKSIGTGKVDLAYLDPSAYCEAFHKYNLQLLVKVLKNGKAEYRSALVSREDSSIEKIVDIKNKSLALGNVHSSTAYLMPLAMFKEIDLGLDDFSKVGYHQKEEQVALGLLVGDYQVGALSLELAKRYVNYGLKIIKKSEPIPQHILCSSNKMNQSFRQKIKQALLSYQPENYQLISFASAHDREYNIVRIMLKNITGRDYITYPPGTLKLAILPLYSAITLNKMFSPLAVYLSQATNREFRLVIPKDFEEFVRIVEQGKVDFAYQNPYVYLLLTKSSQLNPLALTISLEPDKARDSFRGVIITRKDKSIQDLAELKGKKVMIVSQKSAGGYWFQKILLQKQDIDIIRESSIIEGKRHEDVVLAVYRGQADVGFVREAALKIVQDMVDLSKIKILEYTPYYPNWPFAATNNVCDALANKVQKILVDLDDTDQLTKARIKGFTKAESTSLNRLENLVNFK